MKNYITMASVGWLGLVLGSCSPAWQKTALESAKKAIVTSQEQGLIEEDDLRLASALVVAIEDTISSGKFEQENVVALLKAIYAWLDSRRDKHGYIGVVIDREPGDVRSKEDAGH